MADTGSMWTAIAGLTGAAIGGFTSFATSWVTLRTQMRQKSRERARDRRERLYTEFIKEASRLYGDALGHERDDVADLIGLTALLSSMRLMASPDVIKRAEEVLDAIIATYIGPNRTLHEIRQFAQEGGLDPLRRLSEACRQELLAFDAA